MADIPCMLMRGGTSRAPFFLRSDLPRDPDALAEVLIAAMGAGSPLQTDGIGGGQPTTSKVAMLSRSEHEDAQVDYFFAQVHAERREVDFSPSCGNILSAVGPAALEMGLVDATGDETRVSIRNTNTDSLIEAVVQTPGGRVTYAGGAAIDGIPGTAAPVVLNFSRVVGSKTGAMFPTGNRIDRIGGYEVTCIDVGMPMVIARAVDFGKTGYESRDELDADRALFDAFEPVRIEAGQRMGFADVATSVVPKFALVATPARGGIAAARYFMPWKAHPSYAVTGSICTVACLLVPGTVGEGVGIIPQGIPATARLEHPSGAMEVVMDYALAGPDGFDLRSAGLLRTARKLFTGTVHIPD